MFIPPYHLIVEYLGTDPRGGNPSDKVSVPQEFLDFLLRFVLKHVDFDERQYLACNPDVTSAVENKKFNSGREHFIDVGYFEGRVGGTPVQEDWYLARNQDVAAAKRVNQVESGEAQYRTTGADEWRQPNSRAVADVDAWRSLLEPRRLG